MKYKLLSVFHKRETNIGDYVQALASSQFLPHVDGFIDRESLKDYNEDECKVIMNGWFMHDAKQWPPSDKIEPLFVAFHINKIAYSELLNDKSISYLKKYEPIGCRDIATVEILKSKGVDAYFSGCMTLTLGEKYHSIEKDNSIYFVDPIVLFSSKIQKVHYFLKSIRKFSLIKRLASERLTKKSSLLEKLQAFVWCSKFVEDYSKVFSSDIIREAKLITQQNSYYSTEFGSDFELLKEAERLVSLYAKAKLVVTSRIHCALPCLGLNTPVLYLYRDNQSEISACRMNGLLQLFNVIHVSEKGIVDEIPSIQYDSIPQNKDTWKQYAAELKNSCLTFTNN